MTYTSHGHAIAGSPEDPQPLSRMRCGGPGLCNKCSKESAAWQEQNRTSERKGNPIYERDHQLKAKIAIVEVYNDYAEGLNTLGVKNSPEDYTLKPMVTVDDIYTVSFYFILGNWKGTFSSDAWTDTGFFEVTYNKEKKQMYVDYYHKTSNTCFDDDPLGELRDKLSGDAR